MSENNIDVRIKEAQSTLEKAQKELAKIKGLENIPDDLKQSLLHNGEANINNAQQNIKTLQDMKDGRINQQLVDEAQDNLAAMSNDLQPNTPGKVIEKDGQIVYQPQVTKEAVKRARQKAQEKEARHSDSSQPTMTRAEYRKRLQNDNK